MLDVFAITSFFAIHTCRFSNDLGVLMTSAIRRYDKCGSVQEREFEWLLLHIGLLLLAHPHWHPAQYRRLHDVQHDALLFCQHCQWGLEPVSDVLARQLLDNGDLYWPKRADWHSIAQLRIRNCISRYLLQPSSD